MIQFISITILTLVLFGSINLGVFFAHKERMKELESTNCKCDEKET